MPFSKEKNVGCINALSRAVLISTILEKQNRKENYNGINALSRAVLISTDSAKLVTLKEFTYQCPKSGGSHFYN